jgi:hypothetical protein
MRFDFGTASVQMVSGCFVFPPYSVTHTDLMLEGNPVFRRATRKRLNPVRPRTRMKLPAARSGRQ